MKSVMKKLGFSILVAQALIYLLLAKVLEGKTSS